MKWIYIFSLFLSPLFAELPFEEVVIDPTPSEIVYVPEMIPPETVLPEVALSTESPMLPSAEIVSNPIALEHASFDLREEAAAEPIKNQETKPTGVMIDVGQVFAGSPTIYSILFFLSITSIGIWAYVLLSLRSKELFPTEPVQALKQHLELRSYNSALDLCRKNPTPLFGMIAAAVQHRNQGTLQQLEIMKNEGKRMTTSYWQKIGLLNEIAIIAPMLGLLGTVLGMFYAFYDVNRSTESVSTLFDGLGISVGTTVGGLIVAILAMIFHSISRYRLMKQLSKIEQRAQILVHVISQETSS